MSYASSLLYPSLRLPMWRSPNLDHTIRSGQGEPMIDQNNAKFFSRKTAVQLSPCYYQETWNPSVQQNVSLSVTRENRVPFQHLFPAVVPPQSPKALCSIPLVTMQQADSPSSSNAPARLANTPTSSKRGRPRADVISTLQYVGSNSNCSIRCHICHRVFPREKSLQAHLRTHTGERPYRCDYPNCNKSFVQSGQLKTHQRLHSGEKPFRCSEEGCNVRFTHANRHCSEHANAKMVRDDEGALKQILLQSKHQDQAVAEWLHNHIQARLERGASSMRLICKPDTSDESISSDEDSGESEYKTLKPAVKRRLLDRGKSECSQHEANQEHPAVSSVSVSKVLSPRDINRPPNCLPRKKRILAYSEQFLKDKGQENVYPGVVGPETSCSSPSQNLINSQQSSSSVENELDCPQCHGNESYSFVKDLESVHYVALEASNVRSSVLVYPKLMKHPSIPSEAIEEKSRWNSALALIQLASSPPSKNNHR